MHGEWFLFHLQRLRIEHLAPTKGPEQVRYAIAAHYNEHGSQKGYIKMKHKYQQDTKPGIAQIYITLINRTARASARDFTSMISVTTTPTVLVYSAHLTYTASPPHYPLWRVAGFKA